MADGAGKDTPSAKGIRPAKQELSAEDIAKREVLSKRFYDLQPNEVMVLSCPFMDVKARKTERDGHSYLEIISLHKAPYTLQMEVISYADRKSVGSLKQSILKEDYITKKELLVDSIPNVVFTVYYNTSGKCHILGYETVKTGVAVAAAELQLSDMNVVARPKALVQKTMNQSQLSGR